MRFGAIQFFREIDVSESSEGANLGQTAPAIPSAPSEVVELPPSWVRISITLILSITLLVTPLLIVALLYVDGKLLQLADKHAAAIIGVPWAGGAAFTVVLVLRSSFGSVNFKIFGTEFEGASGPIVMWVFCFLVEIVAIKALW